MTRQDQAPVLLGKCMSAPQTLCEETRAFKAMAPARGRCSRASLAPARGCCSTANAIWERGSRDEWHGIQLRGWNTLPTGVWSHSCIGLYWFDLRRDGLLRQEAIFVRNAYFCVVWKCHFAEVLQWFADIIGFFPPFLLCQSTEARWI